MMEIDIKQIIAQARERGVSPEYLRTLAKVLGVSIPKDETQEK